MRWIAALLIVNIGIAFTLPLPAQDQPPVIVLPTNPAPTPSPSPAPTVTVGPGGVDWWKLFTDIATIVGIFAAWLRSNQAVNAVKANSAFLQVAHAENKAKLETNNQLLKEDIAVKAPPTVVVAPVTAPTAPPIP